MSDDAAEMRARWQKQRDLHVSAIGERLRSMSLGALALVWGLLVGTEKSSLVLKRPLRGGLILVALGAVIVLLLDFLDYWMGYQLSKLRAGDKLWLPNIKFIRWKERLLVMKQIVGVVDLLLLVVLLGFALIGVLQAKAAFEGDEFVHIWCGLDDDNNYRVLRVARQDGAITAQFCENDCSSGTIQSGVLILKCGSKKYTGNVSGERLVLSWNEVKDDGTYKREGKFVLANCDDTPTSCPTSRSSESSADPNPDRQAPK